MTTSDLRSAQRLRQLMVGAVVSLALLWPMASLGGEAGASGGRGSTPAAVRLQIASFESRARAEAFIRDNQLGWNDCVLGKRLGVLPPGVTELPEYCTAQTDVEVLRIESDRVRGTAVHRVMTRPIPLGQLWGPLTAYQLEGFEPVLVK